MKSVMKHQFSRVPQVKIPRSKFNRSSGLKTTFNTSVCIPVYCDEALPGDTFNLNFSSFTRLATPIHPFMDNIYIDSFFFAVPIRLIWDNWQKFNGEQDNPGDSTDYVIPQMTSPAGGYEELSLHDYFGLPTKVEGLSHSALFHRAYYKIYNDWFRDQNIGDSVVIPTGDGPDDPNDYQLFARMKRHDYFTSCLPWPQKGEAVNIPIGDSAPVTLDGAVTTISASGSPTFTNYNSETHNLNFHENIDTVHWNSQPQITGTDPAVWLDSGITATTDGTATADLSSATATTINQLRQAFQMQRMFERDARGGTRYTEIIRSHFGVISPDARLQRAEYLGGGTTMLNVHPIPQTSGAFSTAESPQGNLAGVGTALGSNSGFSKSFTEHCLIIGLVSTRSDLTYQHGLDRMWSRKTRYDFYWPSLSHLGEQAVLNKEIYAQGSVDPTADEAVFGYQERYAEYRYKPSKITGKMRSNTDQSLDSWHLSQDFDSLPALNLEFIMEDPPIDRIIAVPSEPKFIMDAYFSVNCARPMPLYGVPGMIDHF